MENLADLFKVNIAFKQSHLLFPSIVEWTMGVLLLAIAVVHGPELLAQWRNGAMKKRISHWKVDKKRFFGSVLLTVVYFAAMEPVGTIYPNSGVGFLLTSIAYGFGLSWLFVHDNNRHKTILMAMSSVITPLVVWLVFSLVFKITLP